MTSLFLLLFLLLGFSGGGDVVGATTVVAVVVTEIKRGGEKVVGREGKVLDFMLSQCLSLVILPWLLLVLSFSN